MNGSKHSLEQELKTLLALLAISARQYDNGSEEAAQALAAGIRTIFHDPGQTFSLFDQLQLKNNVFLLSTAAQYVPGYSLNYTGLIREKKKGDTEENKESQPADGYLPLCSIDKEFTNKWHTFEDWWKELVVSSDVCSLSRKDIVLMVANKDGGALIKGEPDDDYSRLKCGPEGWPYSLDGEENLLTYNAAYATVRQIAFEILKSFEYFNNIKSYNRKSDTKLNALYLNQALYFAPYECEKYPLTAHALVDKRVINIERREVYFDSLIFHDGSKNGRILAM